MWTETEKLFSVTDCRRKQVVTSNLSIYSSILRDKTDTCKTWNCHPPFPLKNTFLINFPPKNSFDDLLHQMLNTCLNFCYRCCFSSVWNSRNLSLTLHFGAPIFFSLDTFLVIFTFKDCVHLNVMVMIGTNFLKIAWTWVSWSWSVQFLLINVVLKLKYHLFMLLVMVAVERLDLQLCFINFNSGRKVTLILDLTCLNKYGPA